MRFYIKFFILGVWLVPIHGAFAGCSTYTSLPSGYALDEAVDVTTTYNNTYCSATKTVYMCDTVTQLCQKLTYCTSCSSSNSKSTTYTYSTCSVSAKICIDCTYSSTQPSGVSISGGPSFAFNCSTTSKAYVTTSLANQAFSYTTCSKCNSGYFLGDTQVTTIGGCPVFYNSCEQCEAGTYKSGTKCISCSAGTYSDTVNASSCTTCPSATDIWVDSSHSSVASVANGGITSQAGANSKSECYLVTGKTYYNAVGAFTHPDLSACYQDGTSTVSGCSTVTYKCTILQGSYTAQDVQTGTIPTSLSTGGQYCFCATNGKYFYMADMSNSTVCSNSCQSACNTVVTQNSRLRTNLGC